MGMLLYGIASYLIFFASFLYAIGFVGNLVVPKTIDSGLPGPLGQALLVNTLLLGLFAISHSVMARPAFKRWWTKFVPVAAERSVYVLVSSLSLFVLFWGWKPMTGAIWSIDNPIGSGILQLISFGGWLLVLVSTFIISHFDLFGLRQVWLHFRGTAYTAVPFREVLLYKYLRHPIMLGFLIAFWATPQMTQGHLLFAVATTGYILIGIFFEERDLLQAHGAEYDVYRKNVGMLIPRSPRRVEDLQHQS